MDITPRQRVSAALRHETPDRVPVDFLATPEVWETLEKHFQPDVSIIDSGEFFTKEREAILRLLHVDCRMVSYDMFCAPPTKTLRSGAQVSWWDALARSTPNRMWRQNLQDGTSLDIWGHHLHSVANETGRYEEFVSWPLRTAKSLNDLRQYPWPEPDWWDFSCLGEAIQKIDPQHQHSLRFRAGSVFENAWQLRGMEDFLMDMAVSPDIPDYIMNRLTEVLVENTRRVLELAGEKIDIVYFYDDVGAQNGLMISKSMWRRFIKPFHQRLIDTARSAGKHVMYHCDGAIAALIPELIEMGIDILNPVQPTAKDMAPERLKTDFGHHLSFHGGIDIVETLPHGSPEQVQREASERVRVLGAGGGYILASSHHIQSDTPLANVLAMYDLDVRG